MAPAPWYHWDGADLILQLRIQPRAKRDEIAGPHGGRLKVRISAPPVDGKANDHLIAFMATVFGVPRQRVAVVAGAASRDKRVRIQAPARLPTQIEPRQAL
ncbi:MAG: DUF167 family protein [Gammaproteobacteria bacterium]|jgi:uncharacterized protein